jgi:hypothetical protein
MTAIFKTLNPSSVRVFRALALVLVSIALWLACARAAHANMARWESDGQKFGPLIARKDTRIRVDAEDLTFDVASDLRSAKVTAVYRMTNTAQAEERVEVAFVHVGGDGDAQNVTPPEIAVDDQRVPFETLQGDQMEKTWSALAENRRLTFILFRLEFAPGASRSVRVTYPHVPSENYEEHVNTTYSYEYLLSPAKSWASFGPLHIEARLPEDTWFQSDLAWQKDDRGFHADLPTLPEGELVFHVMSRRGLLFGMTTLVGYWVIALVLMGGATVLAGRVASRAWRGRSGCLLAGARALCAAVLGAAVNGLVIAILSGVFPERAFGFGYGPAFGFILALFAGSVVAAIIAGILGRRPALWATMK